MEQQFIEQNGLIYKLHESKEERLKRIKEEEDRISKNLHKFKKLIGEDHCAYLHKNNVVLKKRDTYGEYIYDFSNFTKGYHDDYGKPQMESIGKTNFDYQSTKPIIYELHKLIADHYYEKFIKTEETP